MTQTLEPRTHGKHRVACVRCKREKWIRTRGLCDPCLDAVKADGTLIDYPSPIVRIADVVEEYLFFRFIGCGMPFKAMAMRCGMTRTGADQAYRRAIRAGLIEREPYVQPPNHGPGPARLRGGKW